MGDWAQLHRKEAFPINLKDGGFSQSGQEKNGEESFSFYTGTTGSPRTGWTRLKERLRETLRSD